MEYPYRGALNRESLTGGLSVESNPYRGALNRVTPTGGNPRRDSSRESFFSRRNGVFEAVLAGISTTRDVRRVRRRGLVEKGRGAKGIRMEGKKKKGKKGENLVFFAGASSSS